MKNLKRGLSFILTLAMVLGCFSSGKLALAADEVSLTGVSIASAKVGAPSTVTLAPENATGIMEYQWYTHDTAGDKTEVTDLIEINSATDSTFTPTEGQLGKYLYVQVTQPADNDTTESDIVILSAGVRIAAADPETEEVSYAATGEVTNCSSSVTWSDGKFIVPAGVTSFTFKDGDVEKKATKSGSSWQIANTATSQSTDPIYVPQDTEKTKFNKSNDDLGGLTQVIPANADKVKLNLTTETLELNGFVIEGYNTGSKWVKYDESKFAKDLASLFKKGGVLQITDKMNDRGNAVHVGVKYEAADGDKAEVKGEASGYIIAFEKIEKRPNPTKLIANYSVNQSLTPTLNSAGGIGTWTLTEKNKNVEKVDNTEYCIPEDGKKVTDSDKWVTFPEGGLPIGPMKDGKPTKTTYFIKTIAYISTDGKYIPATNSYKVSVASVQKAPSLKPDYKKEIIKAKAGVAIDLGVGADAGKYTLYAKTPVTGVSVAVPKDGIGISDNLKTGTSTAIKAYTAATAKKPASEVQTITLAPRAATPTAGSLDVDDKGKVTLDSTLEARIYKATGTPDKWAKFPKTTKNGEIVEIRVKNTAKQTKEGFENTAASEAQLYEVTVASSKITAVKKYDPNAAANALASINEAITNDGWIGITAATFTTAGVTGVTAENLDAVIAAIKADANGSAYTAAELQAIVDALEDDGDDAEKEAALAKINAAATKAVATEPDETDWAALTVADFAAAGVTKVTAGNIDGVKVALLETLTSGATAGFTAEGIDQIAEVSD